jgi:hypothetical protein
LLKVSLMDTKFSNTLEVGYGFMNPEQEHNHGRFQVQGFQIAAASPVSRTTPGAAADLYEISATLFRVLTSTSRCCFSSYCTAGPHGQVHQHDRTPVPVSGLVGR